jgi:hypothetical protein
MDMDDDGFNTVIYDAITMLIYIVSALGHDPLHDFGIALGRMKKIVSYIDHLIEHFRTQGVGGELNLVGGRSKLGDSRYRKSARTKKTPSRVGSKNFYAQINQSKQNKHRDKSRRGNSHRDDSHRDDSVDSNSNSTNGIKKEHVLRVKLPTIQEENPFSLPSYYTDNMATLPTPVPQGNPYISRYSSAVTYATNQRFNENNRMFELFVHINRLIDSLKLCVIQQLLSTVNMTTTEMTREAILISISVMISQVNEMATLGEHDPERDPELTQEQINNTVIKVRFVLESMYRLLSRMNLDPVVANTDNDYGRYKSAQEPYKWLNLFNGSLFNNIMRVIVFGRMTGLTAAPPIEEIYRLFSPQQREQGGGSGINRQPIIMSGGEKMSLSSFRDSDDAQRNELVATLTSWEAMKRVNPDQAAYDSFYNDVISPPTADRHRDSRLIRLFDITQYSELKKTVKDIRDGIRLSAEPPPRMTRDIERLLGLGNPDNLKGVIDDFMERIKAYFDSFIVEEGLAIEAAEADAATRAIGPEQAAVVYKVSYIIARKILEYALGELQHMMQQPEMIDARTQALLPNLGFFLPVAEPYVRGLLTQAPRHPPPIVLRQPMNHDRHIEKDKYDTLLFQLYLLGLIHHHGTTGSTRGLPDIDSKLSVFVTTKFKNRELKAAYSALGYEYLDNEKSHQLYSVVERNPNSYVVLDNGMPASVKRQTASSSECFNPQRQDGAGDLFGGCTLYNKHFADMRMRFMDYSGRNSFFTKHFYNKKKKQNTMNYNYTIGNGLVIASTIPNIDFSKAPNNLTANNVFKDALNYILAVFKNNPGLTPEQLWDLLSNDEIFKEFMKLIANKGLGDIEQERMCFTPNAGFDPTDMADIRRVLGNKFLFFGVMDRPSYWRALHMALFAPDPRLLYNGGRLVVSYTTDNTASTISHNACITARQGAAARGQSEGANSKVPKGRPDNVTTAVPPRANSKSRSRSRSPGRGGSKTHRRVYKVNARYTRKKSGARR